jgi:hypothetical protein
VRRMMMMMMMMMIVILIDVRGSKCYPGPPMSYKDILSLGIIYKVNK